MKSKDYVFTVVRLIPNTAPHCLSTHKVYDEADQAKNVYIQQFLDKNLPVEPEHFQIQINPWNPQ